MRRIMKILCVEDWSFVLGINEKDLYTILKEYQK